MILGIMGNLRKPTFRKSLPTVVAELRKRKASFVMDEAASNGLNLSSSEILPASQLADRATLILSFGGDGTLLRTARTVGDRRIPILGVNLGPGLGYLTELGLDEFYTSMDLILDEKFRTEERMMLQAEMNGGAPPIVTALNDITVGHSQISRTTQLQVIIDGKPVTTYRCDGLIVATPTGSTAYSLSAGGPILEPTLSVMIVTPISPHTLTMRPVVISANRTLEIRAGESSVLAADGENVKSLKSGDVIRVSRAPYTTVIASVTGHDFYHVLRAKLKWGTAQLEP
ncbi:MAG TPA: NAD(+)/NADH kinase [bacterium]|jgi:NAD+ kinase